MAVMERVVLGLILVLSSGANLRGSGIDIILVIRRWRKLLFCFEVDFSTIHFGRPAGSEAHGLPSQ